MIEWLSQLFIGFLFFASCAKAATGSVVLAPRFEGIQSDAGGLSQRALLRIKGTAEGGPYSFFLEGFSEFESNFDGQEQRRVNQGQGVLQEAYVEFKLDGFFLKAGKQPLRWSEMWVRPSLDVWTARRWNRFLFDPQPEQLEHPGGVVASYVWQDFTVEGAVVNEIARDQFPAPFPQYLESKSSDVNLGARVQWESGPLGLRFVRANHNWKTTTGFALNYSFEKFVSKVECGQTFDGAALPLGYERTTFMALGTDIFLGDWTIQPQTTVYASANDLAATKTLVYLGGSWVFQRYDVQFQSFRQLGIRDSFFHLQFLWSPVDWLQGGVFVQNYQGEENDLFGLYQQTTGDWVAGLRLEFNALFEGDSHGK